MEEDKPINVGWVGDSDEISAIDAVEAEFGVTLDYADAPTWRRAGDVFASLLRQLPPSAAIDADIWSRFAAAITDVSGVDPLTIAPDSPLICDDQLWRGIGRTSGMLWMLLIGGVAIAFMFVLIVR